MIFAINNITSLNITAEYPFEWKHDILYEVRTGLYYIQYNAN